MIFFENNSLAGFIAFLIIMIIFTAAQVWLILVILKLKKQLNSNLNNKDTKVVVEEVKILTENVGINNSRLNEQIENKTLQELIIDLNIKNRKLKTWRTIAIILIILVIIFSLTQYNG